MRVTAVVTNRVTCCFSFVRVGERRLGQQARSVQKNSLSVQ